MKKILITSGGTQEFIDEVRILTNISTGNLGAHIAESFSQDENCQVTYVYASGASMPPLMTKQGKENTIAIKIYTVADLMYVLEYQVPKHDVIIHAMAVSDFSFLPLTEKLSSNSPANFIESLKKRICVTPKVLNYIKEWNPKIILVSFKFEVGLTHEELVKRALKSATSAESDIVIANDKHEMDAHYSHIAYAITPDGKETYLTSKLKIAEYLYKTLK